MYVCAHVSVYVWMYLCMDVSGYMYMYTYCMDIDTYVSVFMGTFYMYECMEVCAWILIGRYMYLCLCSYVYVYMHISIHACKYARVYGWIVA